MRLRRPSLTGLSLLMLVGCVGDPNIPGEESVQSVDGRLLVVSYVDGLFAPAPFVGDGGQMIEPFPIAPADGLLVVDAQARESVLDYDGLRETDEPLARRAAEMHCAAYRRSLPEQAGAFMRAESDGGWYFGPCEPQ